MKRDGGPAFPQHYCENCNDAFESPNGMALRDYFAGQALAGLLANPGGPVQANCRNGWGFCNCDIHDVAIYAYDIADATLAQRERE